MQSDQVLLKKARKMIFKVYEYFKNENHLSINETGTFSCDGSTPPPPPI